MRSLRQHNGSIDSPRPKRRVSFRELQEEVIATTRQRLIDMVCPYELHVMLPYPADATLPFQALAAGASPSKNIVALSARRRRPLPASDPAAGEGNDGQAKEKKPAK
jgi:hypothetical protein